MGRPFDRKKPTVLVTSERLGQQLGILNIRAWDRPCRSLVRRTTLRAPLTGHEQLRSPPNSQLRWQTHEWATAPCSKRLKRKRRIQMDPWGTHTHMCFLILEHEQSVFEHRV